jgi:GNAT superfamily N-acetyltransferase
MPLIERAAIESVHGIVEAAVCVVPHLYAETLDIAGGVAAFVGPGSPLSEATGIGVFAEAGDDEVARLTKFYTDRKTQPRAISNPVAGGEFAAALARAGYVPGEYQNVLAREIGTAAGARDERIFASTDTLSWGRASAAGFMETEPSDEDASIGVIIAETRGVTTLAVRVDERIVAAAAMAVRGEVADLFATSTLPHARGSGWQTRLIVDRLDRAREAGARYAQASAAIGSTSERNFIRAGFRVLYTRTVWEYRPGPLSSP